MCCSQCSIYFYNCEGYLTENFNLVYTKPWSNCRINFDFFFQALLNGPTLFSILFELSMSILESRVRILFQSASYQTDHDKHVQELAICILCWFHVFVISCLLLRDKKHSRIRAYLKTRFLERDGSELILCRFFIVI